MQVYLIFIIFDGVNEIGRFSSNMVYAASAAARAEASADKFFDSDDEGTVEGGWTLGNTGGPAKRAAVGSSGGEYKQFTIDVHKATLYIM